MSISCLIVSIEGNIGSGKSTLLENIKRNISNTNNNDIIFLKEPVDEWSKIKDENGVTILEKFYSDQMKYSFPFQMMAYISRLKLLKDTLTRAKTDLMNMKENIDPKNNNVKIILFTERSLLTDKMVFAKMLYDTGKMEHINYQIYLNWFNSFADEFPVHKVIYVRADPKTCYQRISKRSREGEDKIPLEYLESCSNYHENMLDKSSSECVCQDQLILDGNHDIYENDDILDNWLKEINTFITKT